MSSINGPRQYVQTEHPGGLKAMSVAGAEGEVLLHWPGTPSRVIQADVLRAILRQHFPDEHGQHERARVRAVIDRHFDGDISEDSAQVLTDEIVAVLGGEV